MADTVYSLITDGGGDYATRSAALTAIAAAVASGDRIVLNCSGATDDAMSLADLATLGFSGAGALVINGNATPAVFDDTKYKMVSTQYIDASVDGSIESIEYNDLQIVSSRNNNQRIIDSASGALGPNLIIDGGYYEYAGDGTGTNAPVYYAGVYSDARTIIFRNAVIKNWDYLISASYYSGATVLFERCVIEAPRLAVLNASVASAICRNCALIGMSTFDADRITYVNCATDTAAGTVGTNGITVSDWDAQFTNRAAGDYTLANGSLLEGAGDAVNGENIGVEQPVYVAPAFTVVPATANITDTTLDITLTANKDVLVDILATPAGTTPAPDDAVFELADFGGSAIGGQSAAFPLDSLAGSTPYRFWVRLDDGVGYSYDYVDETTAAPQPGITTVSGDNDIQSSETTVALFWNNGGATETSALTLNGVAQNNYTVTDDNNSSFSLVWPNAVYGSTIAVSVDGGAFTKNVTWSPGAGNNYITVPAGYSEANSDVTTVPDLVANNQIEYNTLDSNGNTVSLEVNANNGIDIVVTGANPPGEFSLRAIDHTDGAVGAWSLQTVSASMDQIAIGADFLNQEPGAVEIVACTVSGMDVGATDTVTAGGAGLISTDGGLTFVSSLQVQNADTFDLYITAPGYGASTTASLSADGWTSTKNVSTRDAVVPTITAQPTSLTVAAGEPYNFVVVANTGGLADPITYQLFDSSNNPVTGQTNSNYSGIATSAQNGNQFYFRAYSSEGGYVDSATFTLTVTQALTQITTDQLVDRSGGADVILANTVINYRVLDEAKQSVLLSGSLTTDASGIGVVQSAVFGAAGDTVYFERVFASGDYVGKAVLLEAAT